MLICHCEADFTQRVPIAMRESNLHLTQSLLKEPSD
jgi:hypothetical protein